MKNKTLLTLTFSFLILTLSSQSVRTVNGGSFTDGLAIDNIGNVYGSEWAGNKVFKMAPNGTVSLFASGFSNPNGIVTNDSGHVFICDHTADSIFKYDSSGSKIRSYGGFTTPAGIKRMPNSNDFIVVEYGTRRIKRLSPNGTVTTLLSGYPINGPAGIAIIDTSIYIANFNDRKIFRFSNSTLTFMASIPPSPGLYNAVGFLTAYKGDLYATQIQGNKIYKVDPNNNVVSLYAGSSAGSSDGPLQTATFNGPNGILADTLNDRLYISDANTGNLRVIENLSVSLNEAIYDQIDFNVYPNPANSTVYFKVPEALLGAELVLRSLDGKELYKNVVNSLENSIDLNEFESSNFYTLTIQKGEYIYSKLIASVR